MQISGETPEGIKVNFTLISAFTSSKNLTDTTSIKTQIFPGFYLQINITNENKTAINGKLKVALAKTPVKGFNFMSLEPMKPDNTEQTVLFRDNASLNGKIALSAIKTPAKGTFNEAGFGGLFYEFNLPQHGNKEFIQVYATHHNNTVIEDKRVNQALKFYYTQYWKNITEVLTYAKENFDKNYEGNWYYYFK